MEPDPPIFQLPDELLEAIVEYLPPAATIACGYTSSCFNKITYEPLVWRRHCIKRWQFWAERHELDEKLALPPVKTKWRQLFNEREKLDQEALELFNTMLLTQQHRYSRMEALAAHGYDVKDLMRRLRDETDDDAEDVLARRFHANAILGQIHRATALEKWTRLQQRQMVRLEEVLSAYDMFVLSGERGDMRQIERELDRLAVCVRLSDAEFDSFSTRRKAIETAKFLRDQRLVGNPSEDNYHALRNNFISLALFDEPHTSLPLQSVAIYCAVARRLGVNAKPSNYPHHVHAVIEASSDYTLDGQRKSPPDPTSTEEAEIETMHMDPWRSSEEVLQETLQHRLLQMGAPIAHHARHLGSTSTLEVALRTGRNIMTSVQDSRERQRAASTSSPFPVQDPDVEASWYSMLWSMLILGDHNPGSSLHRRKQCLPYLIEHFQAHFPEDLGLIEKHLPQLFQAEQEHHFLTQLITTARAADENKKAPNPRRVQQAVRPKLLDTQDSPSSSTTDDPQPPTTSTSNPSSSTKYEEVTLPIKHKIGTHLRHRRFGYEGVIVGWDVRCDAEARWIEQMRVDDLPRGRHQPFYNVVYEGPPPSVFYWVLHADVFGGFRADDKSVRYVAEENIVPQTTGERPGEGIWGLAGRYFLRWDAGEGRFVSNLREEYPDD